MFGPETFVVRAVVDGMAPRIRTGDHPYVDPGKPPEHGSVVLFGADAEAVVRQPVVESGPNGNGPHARDAAPGGADAGPAACAPGDRRVRRCPVRKPDSRPELQTSRH